MRKRKLGLAILSVPSSWSSRDSGAGAEVTSRYSLFQGLRPHPVPCVCLTQSAGEKERLLGGCPCHTAPPPAQGMEPHVNKAPGSDNLPVQATLLLWLASLPIQAWHPLGPHHRPCTTSGRHCMPILWLVSQGAGSPVTGPGPTYCRVQGLREARQQSVQQWWG